MTQHEKIIDMCKDGNWHCGNEFRLLFIFSPHKRRSEIVQEKVWQFEDRKCEHGHKGVRDYRMVPSQSPKIDYYDGFRKEMISTTTQQLDLGI